MPVQNSTQTGQMGANLGLFYQQSSKVIALREHWINR